MVATPLVEPLIDAGANLIKELDASKFPVQAAFWLYFPESAEWRLVIATPGVNQKGSKEAYREIQKVLRRHPSMIRLPDIVLLGPTDSVVQLIRNSIKTGPGIAGIRFTGNTINGVYIDDAYIYRMT